jgi:hypothetical protein
MAGLAAMHKPAIIIAVAAIKLFLVLPSWVFAIRSIVFLLSYLGFEFEFSLPDQIDVSMRLRNL